MSLFRSFCSLLLLIVSTQYLVYTAKSVLRSAHGPLFAPALLRRSLAAPPAQPPQPPPATAVTVSAADSWASVVPLQGAPLPPPPPPPPPAPAAPAAAAPPAAIPNVQLPPRGGPAAATAAAAAAAAVPAGPAPAPARHGARDFFCENRAPPGTAADGASMAAYIASGGRFPIALMTCNRAAQLQRTLEDLLAVRCVLPSDVTVIADSCAGAEGIPALARAAGVGYHLHARPQAYPGEDGAARIAQHYGYALDYMLGASGGAWAGGAPPPGVLVVEDDMAFAPDFYEYFHAVAGLVEADDSLWLASAWNDNGFDYLVADPLALRRTRYFPGLGWLLPRSLWQGQLAAGWPGSHWDHWLRDPLQHRGRDVLYPELPRDYHMGVQGTFMDTGTHNRYFGSIALASDAAFTWDTPEGAASIEASALEAYEGALAAGIGGSGVVHLDSVAAIGAFAAGVGVVWYSCACSESDHASMRPLAAYFGLWHEGGRGSRDGVHELWWLGTARLYLVNVGARGGGGGGGAFGPPVNGAVDAAPPYLLQLMPPGHAPLDAGSFLGASRPLLPQHRAVFGAQWRTPLAHLEGGQDANGQEDSSGGEAQVQVVEAGAAASAAAAAARAGQLAKHGEGGEGGEQHVHSQFMGDLRVARVVGEGAGKGARGARARAGAGTARVVAVLPEGAAVVPAASPGLSCDTVCEMHSGSAEGGGGGGGGYLCAAHMLPLVNTCDSLRQHFSCSNCQDSVGGDQPAQVSVAAPVEKLPGACLVNKDASAFSCSAKWEYTFRLCTCVPKE